MLQPGIAFISSLGFEIFWPDVRPTKISKCYDSSTANLPLQAVSLS